jgi:hypothetical protein
MGFATAAVEALLEEADFSFEVVDALLQSPAAVVLVRSSSGALGSE